MIKFPLTELLDEQACYEWLLKILHPKGLYCPNGHALPVVQAPHDRQRAPIVEIQVSGMWESVSHFYRDRLIRKPLHLWSDRADIAWILTR